MPVSAGKSREGVAAVCLGLAAFCMVLLDVVFCAEPAASVDAPPKLGAGENSARRDTLSGMWSTPFEPRVSAGVPRELQAGERVFFFALAVCVDSLNLRSFPFWGISSVG